MRACHWVDHLPAISAYLELRAREQEQECCRIRQVLPEAAGIAGEVTVHLARRL
jgi:hypothetical protein